MMHTQFRVPFLREAYEWLIRDALERHDWCVVKAAKDIGVDRTSLYKAIRRMDIRRKPMGRMSPELQRFLGARSHGISSN